MARKSRKPSILGKIYYFLVDHRTRVNYWTCSNFAQWIREKTNVVPKPSSGTSEEWHEWHKSNSGKFWYWVTDTGLDTLQNIWMFIPDVYYRVSIYITNRFIDKPHYLDTNLKRGQWHEFDTRLLHGPFEALVHFVEIEKANMRRWSTDDEFKVPNIEKGLEQFDWEISLEGQKPYDGYEGDLHDPNMVHNRQEHAAKEIKELYLWWKKIRPNRADPWDTSGLNEFYKQFRDDDDEDYYPLRNKNLTEEQEQDYNERSAHLFRLEEEQYQEDTDMLVRLIKIRKELWT